MVIYIEKFEYFEFVIKCYNNDVIMGDDIVWEVFVGWVMNKVFVMNLYYDREGFSLFNFVVWNINI